MTGKWIKRSAEDHKCDKPKYGTVALPAATGDVWQCDSCGESYLVVGVSYGDQRDPMPMGQVIHWQNVTSI